MQVLDLLAAVGADIRQRPVAALLDAQLLRSQDDEPQKRLSVTPRPAINEIGAREVVQRGDVFSRHHQYVLGGFRVKVAKGDEIRVF